VPEHHDRDGQHAEDRQHPAAAARGGPAARGGTSRTSPRPTTSAPGAASRPPSDPAGQARGLGPAIMPRSRIGTAAFHAHSHQAACAHPRPPSNAAGGRLVPRSQSFHRWGGGFTGWGRGAESGPRATDSLPARVTIPRRAPVTYPSPPFADGTWTGR
jgi:hypothetical protein